MKVLFAASDRDMMMCFKKIIELLDEKNEVVTAFDGTQVVNLMANNRFNLVILDYDIPRVKARDIIKHLNEEDIPVIAILDTKVNSKLLSDEVLANAYLTLPFLPYELTGLMEAVLEKSSRKDKFVLFDGELEVSGFKLCRQLRLTNEEADILEALSAKREFNAKRAGPYINSLNHKFEKLGRKLHIKYVIGEGYQLVPEKLS